jgi:Spy/CpxP family protein refolding chaperone
MLLPRTVGLLLLAGSAAAQAQQTQPAPAKPADAAAAKPDNAKVCRVHMDVNIPRRICLTKEQWAQVTGITGKGVDATSQNYLNRFGCSAGHDTTLPAGVPGAC